jgi:hypothetical protein
MAVTRNVDDQVKVARIHRELASIADELEASKLRTDELLARRVELWDQAYELSVPRGAIALSSRVEPVTVSQTRRRRTTGKR